MSKRRRIRSSFGLVALLCSLLAGTTVGAPPAEAVTYYHVTTGAYNGTRYAASAAINESTCSGLTTNKLAAMMLAIPVWEIAGGSSTYDASPMVLSRWDGWSNSANHSLYSHTEYSHYKRAHWNPGVGLWQLDTWSASLDLNHAQRASTSTGGLRVARYLRDGYCAGTSTLKARFNGNWYACRTDKCWNTYNAIYHDSNDSLYVTLTSGTDWDGGVQSRLCRWGTGSSWTCYLYDVQLHQGQMDMSDPNGDGSRTPLAIQFLSFTTSSIKRAVWLRGSSGYDKEIIKAVRTSEGARQSSLYDNGWYDWTTLQVHDCLGGDCWWSTWGP